MRRYLAAGIWLAMTVTATVIVWAAVSVVAADVTDRPAPVVAHRDVVVALESGSTTTTTATTAPRQSVTSPTAATTPRTVPGPATTAPNRVGPPTGPTFVPPATTTSTTTPTPPPTKPVPHPGPTTTVPGGTATYSTDGGVVAVGCTSFNTIRLLAALPYDGFQVVVGSPGPLFVQVGFVGEGRNISLSAACFFGQPFQFNRSG